MTGMYHKISVIVLCPFLIYGSSTNRVHKNVNVYSRGQVRVLLNEKVPGHVSTVPLRTGAFPVCGTVSHHLLVSPVINAWFRALKANRGDIGTFIIISPNHYRSGSSNISLSLHDWNTAGCVTKVDRFAACSVRDSLGLKEDHSAFYNEHGIEVLLPFINHYYPGAAIVPVLVDEKNRQGDLNIKLAHAICMIMKNRKDCFLLVSTDFSHRCGRHETDRNDEKSRLSLLSLNDNPARPCSDNTTGLMVLYRVCMSMGLRNTHILNHTDAERYTLTDQGDNITSYFFTFQY